VFSETYRCWVPPAVVAHSLRLCSAAGEGEGGLGGAAREITLTSFKDKLGEKTPLVSAKGLLECIALASRSFASAPPSPPPQPSSPAPPSPAVAAASDGAVALRPRLRWLRVVQIFSAAHFLGLLDIAALARERLWRLISLKLWHHCCGAGVGSSSTPCPVTAQKLREALPHPAPGELGTLTWEVCTSLDWRLAVEAPGLPVLHSCSTEGGGLELVPEGQEHQTPWLALGPADPPGAVVGRGGRMLCFRHPLGTDLAFAVALLAEHPWRQR